METKRRKKKQAREKKKMKVLRFDLEAPLKNTNPAGSWNSALSTPYLYVGSNGQLNGYDAKTLAPFLAIKVAGNVYRARTIFDNKRLIAVVDTAVLLFDNSTVTAPTMLQRLDVKQSMIDFVVAEEKNGVAVLYVLTQQGLVTVTSTLTTLRQTGFSMFAANLNAGLVLEAQGTALYVLSVTHGGIYVFDIGNRTNPRLITMLTDKLYPVDGTQTSQFSTLLLTGGIFGISFYDVKDPLHPRLLTQQESPYLNLVRFVPDTTLIVNGLFLPENQLVLGKIVKKGKTFRYKALSKRYRLPLQFGRLPWNLTLIPVSSRKKTELRIIVTNSTEVAISCSMIECHCVHSHI
jgi:hypothetical protein